VAGLATRALDGAVGRILGTSEDAGHATVEDVASLSAQLAGQLGESAAGRRRPSSSRAALARRLREGRAETPRTLLIEFGSDAIDETPWVLSILECKEQPYEDPISKQIDGALATAMDEAMEEALQESMGKDELGGEVTEEEEEAEAVSSGAAPGGPVVERVCIAGGRTAPLALPRLAAAGDEDAHRRLGQLVSTVGRFMREEPGERWPPELAPGCCFPLKERFLRLVAGTNRGLDAPAEPDSEVMTCVEELEALGPRCPIPSPGEVPQVPEAVLGSWELIWASAPAAGVLGTLPLLDCGRIEQRVSRPPGAAGDEVEVLTSVELSPKGAGLLGLLPALAGRAGARVTVRTLATKGWGNAFDVRVTGGAVQAWTAGQKPTGRPENWPAAPLKSRITCATTFVDDELLVMRSLLGDALVFVRVG